MNTVNTANIAILPSTYSKELDLGSIWTWTIPLWGLFVLVLFLAGVVMEPQVLQGLSAAPAVGRGPINSLPI